MAITQSGNRWIKTTGLGESPFYAIVDQNNFNEITSIGYANNVQSGKRIIEPDPGLVLSMESEFAAFMMTLYLSAIPMNSDKESLDMDEIINEYGLTAEYSKVHTLDFAVLTGRKDYPEVEKHFRTAENPNPDPRPEMRTVPDGVEEDDQMLDVLKFLGLSGYIHFLYGNFAMSWEEYLECFEHFWKNNKARAKQEIGTLQSILPGFQRPPLTASKLAELTSI